MLAGGRCLWNRIYQTLLDVLLCRLINVAAATACPEVFGLTPLFGCQCGKMDFFLKLNLIVWK